MRKMLMLMAVAVAAVALTGCEEFEKLMEPQTTVRSGQNSPTIDQAQAVAYNGPRARVAVYDFQNKTGKQFYQMGRGMSDMLATELLNTNRYIVLEREKLDAVLREQDLARGGRVQPGTGAPTGQIEGAELLVTGAVTVFEPNYQGGGLGSIRIHRRHPGGIGAGIKQAYIEIDLRVIDTRTSRLVAATTVSGKATDIAGGIGGVIGGGSSRMGIGLGAYRNTPMEKAVRACLARGVQFVVSKTPAVYYHYSANNQPVPNVNQPPTPPPTPPPPVQPPVTPPNLPPPPPPPTSTGPATPPPPVGGAQLPAQVYVSLGTVRVYQKPALNAATVATVTRGTALKVQAAQGDWYMVQLANGTPAWIMKGFTSPTKP